MQLWLKSGVGLVTNGRNVSRWADQSGNEDVTQGDDNLQPVMETNALNGKTVVHMDNRDYLQRRLPVNGLTGLTVAVVSATPVLWKANPEWCQTRDCDTDRNIRGAREVTETGCSSTYQFVIDWKNVGYAGGVSVSPHQEEVGYRVGIGSKRFIYADDACNIRYDPLISAQRPSSIGSSFSMDVMVHDKTMNYIYQNGKAILSQQKQRMSDDGPIGTTIAETGDTLYIGSEPGWNNRSSDGSRIAEVLVYKRALSNDERLALERYLNCEFFPDRVKP